MSVDISLVAANLRLDAIAAAAGNAARLRIYSGTRPASVAAAISGTLLAELVCGTPFAPAASGGQLKVTTIADDTSADANGTATHFRLFKADGTTAVLDGSVGAHGDLTADLTVGDVAFVAGTPVQIASWRISASGYRWWDNATLFDFDPFNGRGVVDKVPSLPGGMTATTRSGEARQASANGVWQKFVSNVLSLTNDIGAGIFGAWTNKIRNPRGEGGTIGVIGSGGALPTNWSTVTTGGMSREFKGSGVESGSPYSEIRYFGVATGTFVSCVMEAYNNTLGVAAGQAWGMQIGFRLVDATLPPLSAGISIKEYTAAGAYVSDRLGTVPGFGATRVDAVNKIIVAGGSTGALIPSYYFSLTIGATYDFTIRIYAPKLVQIAVVEGPELVTNGDFASGTGWTLGPNSTIGSGVLNVTGSPAGSEVLASQSSSWTAGVVHKVRFDVATISPSGMSGFSGYGGGGTHASFNTVGTKVDYVVPNLTGSVFGLQARGAGGVIGTFDNLSLKTVTPGYLPTYPILPPVGVPGDSTHNGDVVKAIPSGGDPFAGATAAGISSGLSLAGVETISHVGDGVIRPLAEMSDGSTNNRLRVYIDTDDKLAAAVVSGGMTLATAKLASALTAGELVWAANFDPVNGLYLVRKTGLQNASASLGALPAGLSEFRIGSSVSGNFMNDTKKRQQVRRLMTAAQANDWVAAA